jgi:hypothetical protein
VGLAGVLRRQIVINVKCMPGHGESNWWRSLIADCGLRIDRDNREPSEGLKKAGDGSSL